MTTRDEVIEAAMRRFPQSSNVDIVLIGGKYVLVADVHTSAFDPITCDMAAPTLDALMAKIWPSQPSNLAYRVQIR